MKANTMILMVAILCICTLSGCDDDPKDPSSEELFLKALNGQWTLVAGQVTAGGKDVTNSFKGMTITFSNGKAYSVTNPLPPLWPAGGTFALEAGNNGLFDIRRDDNVLITVSSITTTTMTLQFQYTAPSGRTNSVSDLYIFVMNKG